MKLQMVGNLIGTWNNQTEQYSNKFRVHSENLSHLWAKTLDKHTLLIKNYKKSSFYYKKFVNLQIISVANGCLCLINNIRT